MILKPISEIEASDIAALAENKVPESPVLEYKSRLPGSADSEKTKFLAEISAFANTRGGVLLAGISDVEGVPDEICGIECDDLDADDRVLKEAVISGYSKICLDVLPEFKTALKLYRSYGFVEHPPVTKNPVPGTHFLGLDLEQYNQELQRTNR